LDAWELLVKKQEELSKASRKFTLEKEIVFLNTTLKLQVIQMVLIKKYFMKYRN